MVGMQGVAVKQVGEAGYRSEASLLANELIGRMWVADRAAGALQANFNTGGSGYATWKTRVAAALPGVATNPPTVEVDDTGLATVTVFWQAPGAPEAAQAHRYVAIAQIR